MAKKPKLPKRGFTADDLNRFLFGQESIDLFRQARDLETPRPAGSGLAQQFGSAGMTPLARKFLGQIALSGEAAAKSNIADLFGIKDAYLAQENQSPVNALWAALSVAPLSGAGKVGKTARSILRTLRTGDRNPRLETGTRVPIQSDTESKSLLDAYIYSLLNSLK